MRPNRFQLIELILVITVLVGLFSLLAPTIYNARNSSQTTACLSNLQRTIADQLVTYTANNDDILPSWEDGWIDALAKQSNTSVDQTADPTGPWSCPSQDAVSYGDGISPTEWWRGSHYGINIHLTSKTKRKNGEISPLLKQINVKRIRSPHDKAIIGDSSGGNIFGIPGMDPTISGTNPKGMSTAECLPPNPLQGMPFRRHQDGTANILFLDLHAESLNNFPKLMLGRGTPGFNFWHGEHWYPELGIPEPGADKKKAGTVKPAKSGSNSAPK